MKRIIHVAVFEVEDDYDMTEINKRISAVCLAEEGQDDVHVVHAISPEMPEDQRIDSLVNATGMVGKAIAALRDGDHPFDIEQMRRNLCERHGHMPAMNQGEWTCFRCGAPVSPEDTHIVSDEEAEQARDVMNAIREREARGSL